MAQNTSTGAHALALTIVNDGAGYALRCNAARLAIDIPSARMVRAVATGFLTFTCEGARKYEREFGSPGASCFTVEDILGAAIELAEYYDQHVRDTIAAK